MYTGKVINEINSLAGTYTKSEEKIIDYLNKKLDEVVHLSVTEFADCTEVGETTIVRFCQKLGYKGYYDFKIAVAQDDIKRKESQVGNETISDTIYNDILVVLEDSRNLLDQDQIKDAVKLINQAKNVYFYGIGSSGITATEAYSKFFRISSKFNVLTDNHFQTMAAQIMTKEDLIIVITISGSTKDIVDAVKVAKENGARVVAITNFKKSPITKYTDLVLLTSGKTDMVSGGMLNEKLSQLFVIDILFQEYLQLDRNNLKNRDLTTKSLITKKY